VNAANVSHALMNAANMVTYIKFLSEETKVVRIPDSQKIYW